MDPISAIAILVAGLVFGSFLNVCISRIPPGESIVSPRSHCQGCGAPISWRDNVPVLSWLMLRGRCRNCGQSISLRYPAVELLTAVLFLASFYLFGLEWITLKACMFCFLVVGLIAMDAETGYLPSEFTYPGILFGLLLAWLVPFDTRGVRFLMSITGWDLPASTRLLSLTDALIAALSGAAFFYLAWAAYYLIRKRHGLGFGDVAMMSMIGVFLGLRLTILVVFLAPLLGTVYAAISLLMQRRGNGAELRADGKDALEGVLRREIPFGVFLGISSLFALFLGNEVWKWYLGLFR